MNYLKLIISIIVCQAAGLIGSVFTITSIQTWYATLNKPFFVPPNWLFAPAWTTLFLLMGISLYIIWDKGWSNKDVKIGINMFATQLMLNILWSIIFFGLQNPFYAFIEIVLLWIAILVTIWQFNKISRKAALLLVPYIIWVTFAAALNLAVYLLN